MQLERNTNKKPVKYYRDSRVPVSTLKEHLPAKFFPIWRSTDDDGFQVSKNQAAMGFERKKRVLSSSKNSNIGYLLTSRV